MLLNQNHSKSSAHYFLFFLVCFNVSACTKPAKKDYQVISTSETEQNVTKVIVLPKVISKDSTIEIAREIRNESKTQKPLTCTFYQAGMTSEIAWAVVSYPIEPSKENGKDKDGKSVEYTLVVHGFKSIDDLMALKSTGHNPNDLIKAVPDVFAKVKYEIYRVNGSSNTGLLVTLYPSGRTADTKLKITRVGSKTTCIVDGPHAVGGFILEKDNMGIFYKDEGRIDRRIYFDTFEKN